MHVYGNYGFWSWLRYWYIDSVNYVTMLLLDKGYFDYDYEPIKKEQGFVDWVDTVKSDEEVVDMLSKFGFGHLKKKENKPETLEEIQNYLIENVKED